MPTVRSPYEYYLELLGTWPGSIPPSFSWFVTIDFSSVQPLQQGINNALTNLEPRGNGWNISRSSTSVLLGKTFQDGVDGLLGCAFAQDVKLPGEIIDFDRGNSLNYAGLQTPATINCRRPYSDLEIQFTETTASFVDLVIRPWLVATSFYGLIARPTSSPRYIKANFIDIVQLAKMGSFNKMQPRKITRFINCAPTGVDGITLNYDSGHIQGMNARFIYDSSYTLDGVTGTVITQ